MGWKDWVYGDLVSAADFQSLVQDQTVQRYASSSARLAALGSAVAEGMVSYLDDTNAVEVYTGSAWAAIGFGSGNAIINGAFDVWQRGTSSTTNLTYIADRWFHYTSAGVTTFARDTTTVPAGSQYSMKITQATANATITVNQAIETLNATQFAGQTVTLSAQMAASTSTNVQVALYYSTSIDNSPLGSWTQITPSFGGSATANSSFQKVLGVYAVPSTAKSLYATVFIPTLTVGTSAYVSQVQLEAGSSATAFKRNAPSIQGELAACQRYYWRNYPIDDYGPHAQGLIFSSSVAVAIVQMPVTMRRKPTAVEYAFLEVWDAFNNRYSISSLALDRPSETVVSVSATISGATTGRQHWIRNNANNTGYIAFSAEL